MDSFSGTTTYGYNNANMLLTAGSNSYANDADGDTLTGRGRVNRCDMLCSNLANNCLLFPSLGYIAGKQELQEGAVSLQLHNLDDATRAEMAGELARDVQHGALYLIPRLTQLGRQRYEALLREAASGHDEAWLATQLRASGLLEAMEPRTRNGKTTMARIPVTAAETLAEGEFNRFYMRGLCRRAMAQGAGELIVYRAKQVVQPRPESERKSGRASSLRRFCVTCAVMSVSIRRSGCRPAPTPGSASASHSRISSASLPCMLRPSPATARRGMHGGGHPGYVSSGTRQPRPRRARERREGPPDWNPVGREPPECEPNGSGGVTMSIPQTTFRAPEPAPIEIIGVRFATNERWRQHVEQITHVRWRDGPVGAVGQSPVRVVIEWMQLGGEMIVRGRHLESAARPYPADNPTHLRTDADTAKDDNLLEQPVFDLDAQELTVPLPPLPIAA